MGGCKSQKKTDEAMRESSELREENATLKQANQDRDVKIAELETALANCRTPQPVAVSPATGWQPQPAGYPGETPAFVDHGRSDFAANDRGEMVATLAGNVLFDSGRAEIKSSARKQLDKIARELNSEFRGRGVRIEGHTDSDPIKQSKWKSNDALSEARARAVEKYLVSQGVSAGRVSALGYGSSKPKGSKAASRRVEIVVESR
jgi:outer membrane protein OmpA-like peptidoglycan-associated protein